MSDKKRVLLVGGLAYNIPDELRDAVDIVTHLQQHTKKLGTLPTVDYVFIITDFAAHNLVESVKAEVSAPIVYLKRGWEQMKDELTRRCILPPDTVKVLQEAPSAAEIPSETLPTSSGLSESELWKTYKQKLIEAVKGALHPGELVDEATLLETLSMAGIPVSDCQTVLPRLQMAGLLDSPREGVWRSLSGKDGFEYQVAPAAEAADRKSGGRRKEDPSVRNTEPDSYQKASGKKSHELARARHEESARKIAGLPPGPYRSKRQIYLKLAEYEEWAPGKQYSNENMRKHLVEVAIELGIIDDTGLELAIKHDPALLARKIGAPIEEPEPLPPAPPPSPHEQWKASQELKRTSDAENAKRLWPEVVEQVAKRNKTIGTILGNSMTSWIEEKKIMVCLIPNEFQMYRQKLESTEIWGMVSQVTKQVLGPGAAVRFVLDNVVR